MNFYHDRYEPKTPDDRKQFSPLTLWRNKAGRLEWKFKAPPDLRPLFGLPRLSTFPDAEVWFVEGEKAAQAACELLPVNPVLSWQGGAQAVSKGDYSPIKGRDCVVWPDRQPVGRYVFKFACDKQHAVLELGLAGERVLIAPYDCHDYKQRHEAA